ncbi:hypothetical protein NDU88_004356 [Pleurodeles waltl]|uniref:Uncharacterized protein n=1 Tax=Pleurodeles waltl TaxID=8319 RepID=A0AAV7T765_PLEWA|nr:hypothetical protein NDU88_004356 [Pleurodeles waltl]
MGTTHKLCRASASFNALCAKQNNGTGHSSSRGLVEMPCLAQKAQRQRRCMMEAGREESGPLRPCCEYQISSLVCWSCKYPSVLRL